MEVVPLCPHPQNCMGFITVASILVENDLELREKHEVPVELENSGEFPGQSNGKKVHSETRPSGLSGV